MEHALRVIDRDDGFGGDREDGGESAFRCREPVANGWLVTGPETSAKAQGQQRDAGPGDEDQRERDRSRQPTPPRICLDPS
jgi:hypothetical protein